MMKEIVIDRERTEFEIEYLKEILHKTIASEDSDNVSFIPVSTLDYAIKCMERLVEVYDQSSAELSLLDGNDDKLYEAYEKFGLLREDELN